MGSIPVGKSPKWHAWMENQKFNSILSVLTKDTDDLTEFLRFGELRA